MAEIETLFVTKLYREALKGARALNAELAAACCSIAAEDEAGREWARRNLYPGYTSYASLNDLAWRDPAFAELQALIDPHVQAFAKTLGFDLGGRKLVCDSLWINVLAPGGAHSGHIHPHSVISGVYYVEAPPGSGALRLEDPRLPLMMAAPPRLARTARENRSFVYLEPRAGVLLLWESWLRHEVAPHAGQGERVSVSFNYSRR